MKPILIIGPQACGKTSIAEALHGYFPEQFKEVIEMHAAPAAPPQNVVIVIQQSGEPADWQLMLYHVIRIYPTVK